MRFFQLLLFYALLILHPQSGMAQHSDFQIHCVNVIEIQQVSSYTYLLVSENKSEKWVAAPRIETEKGAVLYYKGGTEMPNFTSKELNKTFASVLFLERITANKSDLMVKAQQYSGSTMHQGNPKVEIQKRTKVIAAPLDGISLAFLLENKNQYQGKTIKLKGEVISFRSKILGKNWIHIQDGTEYLGVFDLTITSDEQFEIGDIVIVQGIVAVNKDFGYGYFYDVIVENAKLISD